MNPRQPVVTAFVLAGLLALAGAAAAQETPYVPFPGTNDLGISENDVRDEPNHPDDANNLEDKDPFFSPKDDRLILDGYAENRFGNPFLLFTYDEDVSNVRNVLVHGSNTEAYEQSIYPGQVTYEAWWGHWSDTGGGGDLQQSNVTAGQAFVGEANGAIDDADDCDDDQNWDEFVWRGQNGCADDGNGKDVPEANVTDNNDQMFAFVQPGTHDMHMNTLVFGCSCPEDATLDNSSDAWYQPDFVYGNPGGQIWRNAFGFSRIEYDASLLVSTQVVSSVNPKEIDKPEAGTEFDPFTGSPSASVHAHDADIYSSVHPTVEDAYRTSLWDPPQDYGDSEDEQNVLGGVHESGLKGFAKYPVHKTYTDTEDEIFDQLAQALESTEPTRGIADDVVSGPWKHEPNTAQDDYEGRASFDAATSYGGLDADYYEPGPGQTYSSYQSGEHFWGDARVGANEFAIWIPFCCLGVPDSAQRTPELPDASAPAESLAQEDDDNTKAPMLLHVGGNFGTWYDANGDTWVGDAHDGTDDDYDEGTDEDPNEYGHAEFRGTCSLDITTRLVPTEDTDGDGKNDWGAAGVYVVGSYGDAQPYGNIYMDLLGDTAQPAGEALRNDSNVGGLVGYMAPDDQNGQLSRYRTEGPIVLDSWGCTSVNFGSGEWDISETVLFPAGTLDISFKATTTAELTDPGRTSQKGTNSGDVLSGEKIVDVDTFDSIAESG